MIGLRFIRLLAQCSFGLGSGVIAIAALIMSPEVASAQTTLPSTPGLNFQTSGPSRCDNIGDWYTTTNNNNNAATCPVNGGASTTNPPANRLHRFFISLTAQDIANSGGSITVSILDAESNGGTDEVSGTTDPTRFTLLAPGGAVISQQVVPSGSGDGTTLTLGTVTAPGVYEVTSETGAGPIFSNTITALNDDDNGFQIQLSGTPGLLIGSFQGTFQQDTGAALTIRLFYLVGPGTGSLALRNFDLDTGANAVSYISPPGGRGTIPGTRSGNAAWNNSGTLNVGADTIGGLNSFTDAGAWELRIANLSSNNQTLFEANTGTGERLPLFDRQPSQAGNFTITTSTTLETPIGQRVCHPFRVTNNFFTTDIVNLTATGTNPNYTTQFFRDAAGTVPLTDTDGDGQVDTGILAANGGFVDLFFCVTPGPGALQPDGSVIVDTTTITGTSFMDREVRDQAGTGAPVPQSVVKTTRPPGVSGAASFRLVKRITNVTRNGAVLPGVNFGAVIDDPNDTIDNTAGFSQIPLTGILALPNTNPVQSGDEVTYTVYFLSDGLAPAIDSSICDPIPGGTTFVLGSLELQRNNGTPTATSNFFTPLTPLPDNNPCPIQTNPNGTALVELGTVSNAAGNNFGFIRFRVRVN